MKILIVNAILYTSETKEIKKINSIKDCMIYDLCLAFHKKDHEVTLLAADNYRPVKDEQYPFNIVWLKSYFQTIFSPNKIPFNIGVKNYIKKNDFDLIISSEVFSLDTLMAVMAKTGKLIIWQEMAFHQKMAKQLASKFWHNIIIRLFYRNVRIVARTEKARKFIKKYCKNVSERIIPHGIDFDKFTFKADKSKYFVVSSQLIERKQINLTIDAFKKFCANVSNDYLLYIIGDGDKKDELERQVTQLKLNDKVLFTGKLAHNELINYLSKAQAMLVYTRKDNSMISIAESIAVGTPVITTSVPDNSKMIKDNALGIVLDNWSYEELKELVDNNEQYVLNCLHARKLLDNKHNVELFIDEMEYL